MVSIVVSGPESTGKSTLTLQLARHFECVGVPEYARDYCGRLQRQCNTGDIETIGRRQIGIFKKLARTENLIFLDTFLEITKVWIQEVHQYCPVWLNDALNCNKPTLALLCTPDLTWEPDPLRQNQFNREYLFTCYKSELEYYNIPWREISGYGSQRTELAIDHVKDFLKLAYDNN